MSDTIEPASTKTDELRSALELARSAATLPFPNEPPGYRQARQMLLAEEIEVRRQLERVAALRRRLPLGGEVPEDYAFEGPDGSLTRLSTMFGRHDTLVLYHWMYGPMRERPCPMCTSLLGPLDANARDIEQNVALAVVALSPVARQLEFARERGWTALRFYSSAGTTFAHDYRGVTAEGEDIPALHVFVKREGKIRHFWAAEFGETEDPGQDPRGAPDLAPLWNILDLTPRGRDPHWYPSLTY